MTLRPARPDDLGRLNELERRAFQGDRISPRQMRYHLANPRARLWVYTDDDDLAVAYILAFFHRNRTPRIYSLATDPQWRGRGIAARLVEQAVSECRRLKKEGLTLEVRQDAAAVIGLYERIGFVKLRSLPGYYEDGGDGWKMMMRLS